MIAADLQAKAGPTLQLAMLLVAGLVVDLAQRLFHPLDAPVPLKTGLGTYFGRVGPGIKSNPVLLLHHQWTQKQAEVGRTHALAVASKEQASSSPHLVAGPCVLPVMAISVLRTLSGDICASFSWRAALDLVDLGLLQEHSEPARCCS